MKRNTGAASIAALPILAAMASPAAAQDLGSIGGDLSTAVRQWPAFVIGAAFLLGLWFFMQGWTKLKNHKEDPRENSMGAIAFHLIGGGGLMFMAGMAGVFGETIGLTGNTSAAGYGTFSGM